MISLSISFALLALVAGMLLLAKTKKEELGKFFKCISYIVILVAFLMLICGIARIVGRMCNHTKEDQQRWHHGMGFRRGGFHHHGFHGGMRNQGDYKMMWHRDQVGQADSTSKEERR